MKKWAIPLAAAALIALVAVAGATFALSDSGDDDGSGVSRDTDDPGESGGDGTGSDVAGICLEGAIDCDDTIDTPIVDPGVCIQIFPTPPECADPDGPVSDEPPPIDKPVEPVGPDAGPACTMEYANKCTATAAAVAELAARLDLTEDAITIVSVDDVQWPDACLGVSQPDVACAEVITAGYRIILEVTGQTYEYHTDGGSRAVLAE